MSSYISSADRPSYGKEPDHGVCWKAFTFRRLVWLYERERALAIQAGRDPATQADVARWNTLGRRNAA